MARPLRIEYPGAVYHITSRGNARMPIFEDDQDRKHFLSVLADNVERFDWVCHAYCLMKNHYHLLIETPDGNLSRGMRQLNGVYTQWFNRAHGRVGHLFQGRYKAVLVEKETYLLELIRYIVLNPVRAGIVKNPWDYEWSSYNAAVGRIDCPEFLHTDWLLSNFGTARGRAILEYEKFVLLGSDAESPWSSLVGQYILGGDEFIESLLPVLKPKSGLKEIPRRQRFAQRPPLEKLIPPDVIKSKSARDRAIYEAYLDHGYNQQEISNYTGLHYSWVSRIISRFR